MLSAGQGCPGGSSGNGGTPGGITPPDDNDDGDDPESPSVSRRTVTTVFDVENEQLVRLSDDSLWRVSVGAKPGLEEGDEVEVSTFFLTDVETDEQYNATRLGLVVSSTFISSITPVADQIELVNGTTWEIFANGQSTVSFWLPADRVLVAEAQDGGDLLIHAVTGEVVQAIRL